MAQTSDAVSAIDNVDSTSCTSGDKEDGFSKPEIIEPLPEIPESSHYSPTLKNFTRDSKQYVWMKDYATIKSTKSKYPIFNYISYENTKSTYQSYLAKFSTLVEPQNFKKTAKYRR